MRRNPYRKALRKAARGKTRRTSRVLSPYKYTLAKKQEVKRVLREIVTRFFGEDDFDRLRFIKAPKDGSWVTKVKIGDSDFGQAVDAGEPQIIDALNHELPKVGAWFDLNDANTMVIEHA